MIKSLRQSELFKSLSDQDLQEIGAKAKMRQFFPNETIVWQGKPSDSLFVITNGIVAVKKVISPEKEHIFAYLMPGHTFGEVGILENQPRSATVAALSDVDVLVIRREDFLLMLHRFPVIAIELAKMLGRYLVESNRRQSRGNRQNKLILLMNVMQDAGVTSVGNVICRVLASKTGKDVVYTEYPSPQQMMADLDIRRRVKMYRHAGGYDILLTQEESFMPSSARVTLLLDNLMKDYDYIVIGVYGGLDEDAVTMLDNANQVVLIAPPTREGAEETERMQKKIRKHLRPDAAGIFTLANRSREEYQALTTDTPFDFDIPFLPEMDPIRLSEKTEYVVPAPFGEAAEMCIDRLERTHQIGVFIPTTVDVDQALDTSLYVERTLNFLAERFGGATSKEAQGVWNSDEAGLVDEKVYIVHTYVTQSDMNKYLDEVIEFIREMKHELRQEAMALEVNHKLTLI